MLRQPTVNHRFYALVLGNRHRASCWRPKAPNVTTPFSPVEQPAFALGALDQLSIDAARQSSARIADLNRDASMLYRPATVAWRPQHVLL